MLYGRASSPAAAPRTQIRCATIPASALRMRYPRSPRWSHASAGSARMDTTRFAFSRFTVRGLRQVPFKSGADACTVSAEPFGSTLYTPALIPSTRDTARTGRTSVKRHSKLTPWRHRKLTPEETAYVDGSAGSKGLSTDGGFRAGRWCWSCRTGVPSRDGTAWLGRTVWSTTTQRKGRSVERQPECRGRLVWRTRCRWVGRHRWLRQASLEAALSRARTTSGWALTLGRARILRSAPQGRGRLARWSAEGRAGGSSRSSG